jgi:hypothetical protein
VLGFAADAQASAGVSVGRRLYWPNLGQAPRLI